MLGLLQGKALTWAEARFAGRTFSGLTFSAFLEEFRRVFESPATPFCASSRLFTITQDRQWLGHADYTLEFGPGWPRWIGPRHALCAAFYNGLVSTSRDELASREEPVGLEALIKLTGNIDSRLQARRRERRPAIQFPPRFLIPPGDRLQILQVGLLNLRVFRPLRNPCRWEGLISPQRNGIAGSERVSVFTVGELVTPCLPVPGDQKTGPGQLSSIPGRRRILLTSRQQSRLAFPRSRWRPRPRNALAVDGLESWLRNLPDHQLHVRQVLQQRLLENRLFVKKEKCEFHASQVDFLGFIIKEGCVQADPAKTLHPELLQPRGGAPVTALTSPSRPFVWSEEAEKAFNRLRTLFTTAPVLVQPDPAQQFVVEVDASKSDIGVGAVLSQRRGSDGRLFVPGRCPVTSSAMGSLRPSSHVTQASTREELSSTSVRPPSAPFCSWAALVPHRPGFCHRFAPSVQWEDSHILTIVDRFSKAAHFVALAKLPTARETADLLANHVVRLSWHSTGHCVGSGSAVHLTGLEVILYGTGGVSESHLGVPSSIKRADGEDEPGPRVSALRCVTAGNQSVLGAHTLPWVELAHNSLVSSATGVSPFEASARLPTTTVSTPGTRVGRSLHPTSSPTV
ncbi:hypothetical protein L3Q82_017323 [Scortum barcoo]|uniref:Uncharacterized protein n=1 Tax=Scortum barcoo TaxID=214431 RepID=A0ACB8VK62_9TELE|nr:hypothetical protein L3Q82_017323 [Scortum barcoo]